MKTVYALQNDTVDAICWRNYGRSSGVVEAVLEANPHLSDLVHFSRWGQRFSYQNFKHNKIKRKAFSFGTENKNMTEPTTSTTVAITASAGLVSLLPFVNGDALFGAVIGAAFLAYTQDVTKLWKTYFFAHVIRCLGLCLSP